MQGCLKLLWSNSRTASSLKPRADVDRGMIPLINVVFLMLAFLVLAGQIEAHHRKLAVPKSASEVERIDTTQTLTVFADGSLELDDETIALEGLPSLLERNDLLDVEGEKHALLVVADASLLVSDLQQVLNELQRVGVATVNIATLPANENGS